LVSFFEKGKRKKSSSNRKIKPAEPKVKIKKTHCDRAKASVLQTERSVAKRICKYSCAGKH